MQKQKETKRKQRAANWHAKCEVQKTSNLIYILDVDLK